MAGGVSANSRLRAEADSRAERHGIPVFVPPLRQRPNDIWPIALYYLGDLQRRFGRTGICFSERMRRAFERTSSREMAGVSSMYTGSVSSSPAAPSWSGSTRLPARGCTSAKVLTPAS